jgi:CTP:molybdopterin cytidylyltransferase MocA
VGDGLGGPEGPDPADRVLDPVGAIVLAGGHGRRLGGVDKAALDVSGRSLLARALAAVSGVLTVVVGPYRPLPPGVIGIGEYPPGGGPAAAAVAGFTALEQRLGTAEDGQIPGRELILLLAVDHPGVTPATFTRLVGALRPAGVGGAVLVHGGRRQYGVGVYSAGALRWSMAQRPSWHGIALRSLVGGLVDAEVPAAGAEADDIDTPDDLRRWRTRSPDPGGSGDHELR